MVTRVHLTGRTAIEHIRDLIASEDPAGALAYWQTVRPLVWDCLSGDELGVIGELLSGADRMVRFADDDESLDTSRSDSSTPSS